MREEQENRRIQEKVEKVRRIKEKLERKKIEKKEIHKQRGYSVQQPLYKKLEREFEEKVILPDIRAKQQKLEEYKKFRGRQASLQELKFHQKQHQEIIKAKLKELSEQRDYRKKFPSVPKIEKSPWIDKVKEIDNHEKQKFIRAAKQTHGRLPSQSPERCIQTPIKKPNTADQFYTPKKNRIYLLNKNEKGKTKLELKAPDLENINETQNDKMEESGAVLVDKYTGKKLGTSPNKLKVHKTIELPPWRPNNKKLSTITHQKPPKVPKPAIIIPPVLTKRMHKKKAKVCLKFFDYVGKEDKTK